MLGVGFGSGEVVFGVDGGQGVEGWYFCFDDDGFGGGEFVQGGVIGFVDGFVYGIQYYVGWGQQVQVVQWMGDYGYIGFIGQYSVYDCVVFY